MEKTQKRLGREILIGYAVIAALLVLMIVVGELSNRGVLLDSRGMTDTASNVARILFFGALIGAVCRICRLKRTLANRILLKEEQIGRRMSGRGSLRTEAAHGRWMRCSYCWRRRCSCWPMWIWPPSAQHMVRCLQPRFCASA